MNGIWRSRGYGYLLELDRDGYRLDHLCPQGRISGESGTRGRFDAGHELQSDGASLSLRRRGDLTWIAFDRLDAAPALPHITPGEHSDPQLNFDVLWSLFDTHYAFFQLRGVDWAALRSLREEARGADNDALRELFARMLLPLEDGHVALSTPAASIKPVIAPQLRAALRRDLDLPSLSITPRASMDALAASLPAWLARVDAGPLRSAGNGLIHWCRIGADLGYINVLRLFGYAQTEAARRADDLPRDAADCADFLARDAAELNSILDTLCTELADCRSMILDLRINGGGFDVLALAIAARFSERGRLAFSKRAVCGPGAALGERQDMHCGPAPGAALRARLFVLSSPLCLSAGEILLLALRALPQATLIGMPSAGMLSDNLIKPLPNGWELSLSNELYSAHDGAAFEGCGVQPDIQTTLLDADQALTSLQAGLVRAVEMAADSGDRA